MQVFKADVKYRLDWQEVQVAVLPRQVKHWLSQVWHTPFIAIRLPEHEIEQVEPSRLNPDLQLVHAVADVQFRQLFTHS